MNYYEKLMRDICSRYNIKVVERKGAPTMNGKKFTGKDFIDSFNRPVDSLDDEFEDIMVTSSKTYQTVSLYAYKEQSDFLCKEEDAALNPRSVSSKTTYATCFSNEYVYEYFDIGRVPPAA